MYPIVRIAKEILINARARQPLLDTYVSTHLCWPWDLDVWMELNNGRTLTLFDFGRFPLFLRTRLGQEAHRMGLMITMAGAIVRYRRRVRVFDRITMKTRLVGWDARFFYLEQAMFRSNGECANHIVYRVAAANRDGLGDPARVAQATGFDGASPVLPEWVELWSATEAQRPWPPMQDTVAPAAGKKELARESGTESDAA